jgi:hypothetical protein
MENKTKAYIDIDGVLLTTNQTKRAENIFDFLEYLTRTFDCYWLTTHCKGNNNQAILYLSQFIDSNTLELAKTIKPTNWDTLKTEGIDFTTKFIWFDDYPFYAEKLELSKNKCEDRLIEVNLNRENELLNIIETLKAKKQSDSRWRGLVARAILPRGESFSE